MQAMSTAKSVRTRRAIVDVAVRRFAQDGFQRTSITDVAGDVGVSPPAVYRYFQDKEALFLAAVDQDADGLVALARQALGEADGSLVSLLDRLVTGVARAVQEHPLAARVLSGRERVSPAHVLELPSLRTLRGEVTEIVRLGQEIGLVRDGLDPARVALALETLVIDRLAQLVMLGDGGHERWAAVTELIDVALTPPVDRGPRSRRPDRRPRRPAT
jgi:AcrR family transcriptional regulator